MDQTGSLNKIIEVVEALRATPDDMTTLKLITELKKLAKPKKQYDLCAEYVKAFTENEIERDKSSYGDYDAKDMMAYKKQFEGEIIPKRLKEEKRAANHALSDLVDSGISTIWTLRGRSAIEGLDPDYSTVFETILAIVREDGLYGHIYH